MMAMVPIDLDIDMLRCFMEVALLTSDEQNDLSSQIVRVGVLLASVSTVPD